MRISIKTTFKKGVVIPSALFIVVVSLFAGGFPRFTAETLDYVKDFIFANRNWIFVWSVSIFIIFLVYLMFSKYGKLDLERMTAGRNIRFFPGRPCSSQPEWVLD